MFVISFMDSVNASQCTIILIFKLSFVSFMFSIPLNSANICLYFYCLSFQRKYVSNCPYLYYFLFNQSDQISRSVVSDSLRPHESQQVRPPCPHQLLEFTETHVHRVSDAIPAISSSVFPFSSCPQSLPASESFPMSQLFA